MALHLLLADRSDRKHWIGDVARKLRMRLVLADTPTEVLAAGRRDNIDLVLLADDFPEAVQLASALGRRAHPTVIGLDSSVANSEALYLNRIPSPNRQPVLEAVLLRHAREKRFHRQARQLAHHAVELHALTKELRATNRRMSLILESMRRLIAAESEEQGLHEFIRCVADFSHSARALLFIGRRNRLVPKMALGIPPERLAHSALPITGDDWRKTKPFARLEMIPDLDHALRTALGRDDYFVLPLGPTCQAQAIIAIAMAATRADKVALRTYAPIAWQVLCKARQLRQWKALAHLDSLTGVANHGAFQRVLRLEIKRHQRMARPLSLVLFDVDHFKQINDHYGHPAGDSALRTVTAILQSGVRETDFVARYGGEEFAVLLLDTTREGAEAKTAALLERVRQLSLEALQGIATGLTLSAGIACYPADGDSATALIKAADRALYAAKHTGRDRAMTYTEWLEQTLRGEGSDST